MDEFKILCYNGAMSKPGRKPKKPEDLMKSIGLKLHPREFDEVVKIGAMYGDLANAAVARLLLLRGLVEYRKDHQLISVDTGIKPTGVIGGMPVYKGITDRELEKQERPAAKDSPSKRKGAKRA